MRLKGSSEAVDQFAHLRDPAERVACEFLQEVVNAISEHVAPVAEVQSSTAPSRRELARKVGIGNDSVNDILLGRVWPRSDRFVRMAQAAGVSIGVL